MAKIITLFNHKGGVGKTTTTHNLGSTLYNLGKKVLLVDADPQMNLTSSVYGLADSTVYNEEKENKWQQMKDNYTNISQLLSDLITGADTDLKLFNLTERESNSDAPPLGFNFNREEGGRLDLVSGDIGIYEIENYISGQILIGASSSLKNPYIGNIEKLIRKIGNDYDYVLIDTSPSANSILNGILVLMSDYFVIPVLPSFFSLQAINNLSDIFNNWIKTLSSYQKTTNYQGLSLNTKFIGVIINCAKRFQKGKDKKLTTYSQNWSKKLNNNVEKLFAELTNKNKSITREEFKNSFPESTPFIIREINDFTGQLRNVSEIAGVPIVDMSQQIINNTLQEYNLKANQQGDDIISMFYIDRVDSHYTKAFKHAKESYQYIARCLDSLK
jgi:chromosome partitioning protein